MPLASLKLTVWLLAMSVFLVFVGTLAQVDHDVWQVVRQLYFRVWIAIVPLKIFFPRTWNIPSGLVFPFPGGATLGWLLIANLLAAHSLRFKIRAQGTRLFAGLVTLLAAGLLTWLVIRTGVTSVEATRAQLVSSDTLWTILKLALGTLVAAACYPLVAMPRGQWLARLGCGLFALAGGGLLVWLLSNPHGRLDDSGMRILWQLIKGTSVGLVLLAASELLFHRRAGIVVIHLGILLMMVGELLVAKGAVEGNMSIREGTTANFARDLRASELAITDLSAPEFDHVAVVPQSLLVPGKRISDPQLPCDLEVIKYFPNATISTRSPGDDNPATLGVGKHWTATSRTASTGVEMNDKQDVSAAYVRLFTKGTDRALGVLMCSQDADLEHMADHLEIDGRDLAVALRFKRIYKPYAVQLDDVRAENYLGTTIPRNYSSDIRLVDADRDVDRPVHIWMNNPLHYREETFFQSSYSRDQSGEITVLSVVTNSAWLIPYISCMIVVVGLGAHFLRVLLRFLHDVELHPKHTARANWWIPAGVTLATAAYLFASAKAPTPAPNSLDLAKFASLPVMHEGRVKPLDTLARLTMQSITNGTQSYRDADKVSHTAIEFLLTLFVHPEEAISQKIVKIDNPQLQGMLGLTPREGSRFALSEFLDKMSVLDAEVRKLRDSGATDANFDAYQLSVQKLNERITALYKAMKAGQIPEIRKASAAADMMQALQDEGEMISHGYPLLVPPNGDDDRWTPYPSAVIRAAVVGHARPDDVNPATVALRDILNAAEANEPAQFNDNITKYQTLLDKAPPIGFSQARMQWETLLNRAEPFYRATMLYLIVFITSLLAWLTRRPWLRQVAFWLCVATFALHSVALVARMYISGRPPITNLYSASVFVGWGVTLFALVLESIYGLGLGVAVAAIAGALTLTIAHFLSLSGDTMTVLRAVLDTQFWLATHVVCEMLGYGTTFLAGLFGFCYILGGVFTKSLTKETGKTLARMIYGIICFAIFFSFFGTVLGGLWADNSWGRFWGWDPKENGALIIVLFNALILHARWGGMIRERGLATLAVGGNITTAWSMFGTNMLGIGLHAYADADLKQIVAIFAFVALQLAVIAVACWPTSRWRSAMS
jgi:ABC-type transport system involved in cytochrome c biogenesis permease subunit